MYRYTLLATTVAMLIGAIPAAGAEDPNLQDMAGASERMAIAATPNEHHAALARLLGEWKVELVMTIPGMPEQVSQGTGVYEWVIEGRWLGERVKASMMGMPYESFSLIGYDTNARNHVAATVSSMDTALNVVRGVVVDPSHQTTAMYGTLDEYMTGETGKPYKVVSRTVDKDHHVVEVWDLGIGVDGAKVLEFRFSR